MKKIFLFGMLLLLVNLQIVQSQIPKKMSYQGVLKLITDVIAPNGDYNITFKMYEAAVGGDSIWSETQFVSIEKGILNVILGSANPLDLAFDKPYWLGVTVEAFPELAPRIELTTAPYCFRAQVAETALVALASGDSCLWETDGNDAYRLTGNVGIGTSTPSHPMTIDRAGHQLMLGGTATGDSRFGISTFTGSGDQLFTQFDPFTPSSNSVAILRFFRNTNTTGLKALHLLRGDGTSILDVQLGVDGADTYFQSGDVGIGTDTPNHKLDVNGDVNANSYHGDGSNLTGITSTLKTYDSGWFNVTTNTAYPIEHNLGTTRLLFSILFNTSESDINAQLVMPMEHRVNTDGNRIAMCGLRIDDNNAITIRTGNEQLAETMNYSNGESNSHNSGFYKVIILALE